MKNRIRIAIQKSGRLNEESLNLLRCCGIQLKQKKDQLFCHSDNFPLDALLVRHEDIPQLVASGVCDFGIAGNNLLLEKQLASAAQNNAIELVRQLDFGYCRLAIAVPEAFTYENLTSLTGLRIATTYPLALQQFAQAHQLAIEITTLTGSVEIAPRLGIADAICDLVATGETLAANHLKEVETLFASQAVLLKTQCPLTAEKMHLADILQKRVTGSQQANQCKYIMLHAPKTAIAEIVALLPGSERPSLMMLEGNPDRVALHALCQENIFWETLEALKTVGASSILVLPVEKMLA